MAYCSERKLIDTLWDCAAGFLEGHSFGGVEHVTEANGYGVLLFFMFMSYWFFLRNYVIVVFFNVYLKNSNFQGQI